VRPTEGALALSLNDFGVELVSREVYAPLAVWSVVSLLSASLLSAAWFWKNKESKRSQIWSNLKSGEASFPGSRALVVEHRLPEQERLRRQLESLGLDVAEEGNGSRAVDRALNARFDVIFLSLDLPIIHGEAVAKLLRTSGIRTAIVMVCPAEQETSNAGERFEFVLSQPTQAESLCEVLQKAIPKRLQAKAPSTIREDLIALDEAFTTQDFERLAMIAQKLRDCGRTIGSEHLTTSAERLEACLHEEDLQDTRLMELRDTIGELNSLAQDCASVDDVHKRIQIPK